MDKAALSAANQFIQDNFQGAEAAFFAGSYVRGDATETSDLDLVVIALGLPNLPYRQSLMYEHLDEQWPVEIFVHSPESVYAYFRSDCERRRPALPQMCAEAVILLDKNGLAQKIHSDAEKLLMAGPPMLSLDEQLQFRYQISDVLSDFQGAHDQQEVLFIVSLLIEKSLQFCLAMQQFWYGQGKWAWRALKSSDPTKAAVLAEAMQCFYGQGLKKPLIDWVSEILEPYGGMLFEGYYSSAAASLPEDILHAPLETI